MGILYIDEAGNSGYKDISQPNLIYGGPYIERHQWKKVRADYEKIVAKYQVLIYSQFHTPETIPRSFKNLFEQINFFQQFHFHATEIINGKGLWGKLTKDQSFELLCELLDIMIQNNVKFYAGILNKEKLLKSLTTTEKVDSLIDFKELLPYFFQQFEQQITDEYIVLVADGEPSEKQVLYTTLQSSALQKCILEEFIEPAKSNPFLQLADTGLWVIQAYHRLQSGDKSKKSKNIKMLYQKLSQILNLYIY